MRKKIGIFLVSILLVSVATGYIWWNSCYQSSSPGGGNTYYVSAIGNDSNPGTPNSPFRTIQKAMNVVNPGDTVLVRGGTYKEGRITLRRCGTPNNWINIKAYPNETPIIDGSDGYDYGWGGGLVQIGECAYSWSSPLPERGFWGVEYVKFDGFTVQNTNGVNHGRGYGISTNFCRYVIVSNCTTMNTGSSGIGVKNGMEYSPYGNWNPLPKSHHIWILNNHIYNANSGTPKVGEALSTSGCEDVYIMGNYIDSKYEGISAGCGCNRITIAYNEVVDDGINIYIDAEGLDQQDFWVYGNYCHGNGNGCVIGTEQPGWPDNPLLPTGGSVRNVYIYNNIFASTRYHGVGCVTDSTSGIKQNIQIINNVFDCIGYAIGMWVPATHIWEDVVIRNNIIKASNYDGGIRISGGVQPVSELTIDHNFFACDSELYGTNYLTGDPKWVNPSAGDYHLQSTSLAIDAGSNIDAPSVDFDGNPRPQGTAFDVGAYEYGSGNNPPTKYIYYP